jgi:hypothetical protein
MRKLILIAAFALVSATANGGQSRSLSLASTEATQPAAEQPTTVQKTNNSAPTVEQPIVVAPQQPATPTGDKTTDAPKPKKRHISTEARVIYELHRHGIYW